MDKLSGKILDFYLYSSIHIALAATCLVVQTYLLFGLELDIHYVLFIFSGTLFLYALHNIKGIYEPTQELVRDKMMIITKMKIPVIILAILSAGILLYNLLFLNIIIITVLSILGFISIWYVVPVFGKQKRLRDYSIIKIFLIALVWAALSLIPMLESSIPLNARILLFLQNYLYIFALTIPFDIRDCEYEKIKGLKTLPSTMGKNNSIILAAIILVLAEIIALYQHKYYGYYESFALIAGYIFTTIAVYYSKDKKNDYYFTGFLDGMTILIFLMVLIAYISNIYFKVCV